MQQSLVKFSGEKWFEVNELSCVMLLESHVALRYYIYFIILYKVCKYYLFAVHPGIKSTALQTWTDTQAHCCMNLTGYPEHVGDI